jgi:hypothetical protein
MIVFMPKWIEEFVFAEPWWDLRGTDEREAAQRAAMQAELDRELDPSHQLAARHRTVIARSEANDDIAVDLDGDEVVIVHLTWTSEPPERPPLPATKIVRSAAELNQLMDER